MTPTRTVADAEPKPDLIHVAMNKAGADSALMIGDSTWDCEAAARANVASIAVLTGGFSDRELRQAGASAVFENLEELRSGLRQLPADMSLAMIASRLRAS